jgi:hypothetical protein
MKAFDTCNSTKNTSFGACSDAYGFNLTVYGECSSYSYYLDLTGGQSVLIAFRFITVNDYPARDPIRMTIGGSNEMLT